MSLDEIKADSLQAEKGTSNRSTADRPRKKQVQEPDSFRLQDGSLDIFASLFAVNLV